MGAEELHHVERLHFQHAAATGMSTLARLTGALEVEFHAVQGMAVLNAAAARSTK